MMPLFASWDRFSLATALFVLALYLRHRLSGRRRIASFSGRRVLITGAGSGVGAALARLLNELGAELVLCGRTRARLEETAGSLPRPDLPVTLFELDLNQPDALEPLVEAMRNKLPGPVHVLINNAGQSYRGQIADTAMSVHAQLMRVNYLGHVALTSAWMKHLRRADGGGPADQVVFISSVQGRISIPYRSAYSAPKHALQAFADCLRAEQPDLRVLVATPGYINTNLSRSAVRDSGDIHAQMDVATANGMTAEAAAQGVLGALAEGRHEVVMAPLSNRVAIQLRAIWPALFFALMRRRAAKTSPY